MKKILTNKIYLFSIIVILISTIYSIVFAINSITSIQKDNLLTQVKLVANSIDIDLLKQLEGKEVDIDKIAYIKINKQLKKIRLSNKACKYLYIIGKRDNEVYFFFSDSQSKESENYAKPGLIYKEISQEYKDAIQLDSSVIVGSITDRWGTVVTALAPIKNLSTGRTIATLGMDNSTNEWNDRIIVKSILLSSVIIFVVILIVVLSLYNIKNKQLEKIKDDLYNTNQELEKISTLDKLTNIYNRRKIDEVLDKEIKLSRNTENLLGVIMIDIDHFKNINDMYGHAVGDKVLVKIANILKEHIRTSDFIARWGGEEFIVVCINTDIQDMKILSDKIRVVIENYDFEITSKITVSCGISLLSKKETADDIFKKADSALYRAKNTGRNCVVIYE